MSDPRPWLDDDVAPPEVRRLLAYATVPRPLDARARERSRGRLVALASVPAAAGVLLWIQHLALGAALGAAVSVGAMVARGVLFPKEVPRPVSSSARSATARPSAVAAVQPRSVTSAGPEPLAPAIPRSDPLSARRPPASAAPSEDDGVEREAALLESARRSLHEPSQALSLLARHQHEFPRGVLAVERELLVIEALVRAGRRGEAEKRGAQLRIRAPGNLYAERLERLLGNQGESK
jgi:hypothetical protein